MDKFVYSFNEGSKDMRDILGGKGANLAEMTKIGLPVPFGFTVSTQACNKYYEDGNKLSDDLVAEILEKMTELEHVAGKKFGDEENPLLVSVRSGSVISMPGMMDTILNLGMNDKTVRGLAKLTDNPRFAFDSYRRFLQMFGNVVLEIEMEKFDEVFNAAKQAAGAEYDIDLKAEDLEKVIEEYKKIIERETGRPFAQEPAIQLILSVKAVFRSWNNERAILYRKLNKIPDDLGTAVNVQRMVFGNMGPTSGTGVAFTRNPATGENHIFGEFLVNAQGEDVVAGIRTPEPIDRMAELFPVVYDDFTRIAKVLETHYKDMQDMEFTVENNKLFMLQTRNGKRTATAAVKIAVDMVDEELIDKDTAILRIDPKQVDQLLHHKFDDKAEEAATVLAKGLPASPGAACGQIYFTAADAEAASKDGHKVILVREETSPEDLAGIVAAEGILTARGGMTSHAAVVARGMGKCCVAGCAAANVTAEEKKVVISGKTFKEGDYISLNGSTGAVYEGEIETVRPELSGDFAKLMSWADGVRTMKVRTNADTPEEAKLASDFGAEGIGLCRTEHMFFSDERIPAIREMIMADTEEERRVALRKLLPYQKEDFIELFKVMENRPVTIRLLDPPLHEFLPKTEAEFRKLSEQIGVPYEKLIEKAEALREVNPMLGKRGCRLAITNPEIAEMQTKAIMTAAIEVQQKYGYYITPEIMIPLVSMKNEMKFVKKVVVDMAEACKKEYNSDIEYMVGTMIEVPRATIRADEIAEEAEFFSFGTNDLTQLVFGFSRDDAAPIIEDYVNKGLLKEDVFKTLDRKGVGTFVKFGVERGKSTRPNIKLGVCGEHGGDPQSIEFFYKIGIQYVSCSPFRVPIARLAAAQAVIKNQH